MSVRFPPEVDLLDHRVVETVRLPDASDETTSALARTRMLPALAVAHTSGDPLVCCWLRTRPHSRVAVLLGGAATRNLSASAAPVDVNFPAGCRARALAPAQGSKAAAELKEWKQLLLSFEPLVRSDGRVTGPDLEDLFALLPGRPMGFLSIARPLDRADVEAHLDELSDLVDDLQSHAQGRGSERLRLERAEAELRYLEQWSGMGFWRLEVWAAGAAKGDATAVGGLLGSCAGLADLPVRIRPGTGVATSPTGSAWTSSLVVGADVVAAVARSPHRELPGIRTVSPTDFDVTPEVGGSLQLGDVLDATRRPCLPFTVPTDSVNRHVFVTGATGSGKSQSVRSLLEQLTAASVPWLVIEPAKSEYARMAGRLAGAATPLVIIRPGRTDVAPASLNPLEPTSIIVGNPPRRVFFPLQTHLDYVRALFTAAFDAQEPFPQILAQALSRSYQDLGWNLTLGRAVEGDPSIRPRFPTLLDLQRAALATVEQVGYGAEVRDNVRGFVDVRISSLRLGTPGRFFEGGHPLDLQQVIRSNVIFEIEDLGDDNDKAFFIGTILVRLFELLRLRQEHEPPAEGLRHATIIEEAHRLLRNVEGDSPAAHAVTMFANLLAEVRAYGEGIVVAEQIPAKIIPDVVKNSAIKLLHRLPAADDRSFVGSTMNLSQQQSEVVVSLAPGMAIAHVDGMDRPILVQVDASGAAREQAVAVPGPPPSSSRSTACPTTCRDALCTLEDMVRSEVTSLDPRFVLWAEIATAAHLLGEPLGQLTEDWVEELDSTDAARLRCAVGIAVAAAVDRRSRHIRRFYDPNRLKREVADTLARQHRDRADLGRPDPAWQVGRYRWADAIRALGEPATPKARAKPHPRTAEWAKRGLALRGGTWDEQRAEALQASARIATPFRPTFVGEPDVITPTARMVGRGPDEVARLKSALTFVRLPTPLWPPFRLCRATTR